MGDFLQFTLTGMTIGSIYAIVALGFVTIYSVTKVINLAQGEFVMLGGLTMYSYRHQRVCHIGLPLSLRLSLLSLIGWLMEFVLIRRAKGADPISLIILTIGTSIFIRGIASMIWGKTNYGCTFHGKYSC